MTSTSDTSRHPDVSEISELTEGLLPPARSAAIRHHLDACDLCTDVRLSLEEIRGLLGTLPGPSPMPSDVAERIDAALAAEALLSSADAVTVPAGPSLLASGVPPQAEPGNNGNLGKGALVDRAPEPAQVSRETSVRRPAGHPGGDAGPGRSGTRRRRRVGVLSALVGAAAVAAGVLVLQPSGETGSTNATGPRPASSAPVDGTTDFSASRLQSRVDSLLATLPSSAPSTTATTNNSLRGLGVDPAPDNGSTTVSPETESNHRLPACIQQGTGRTDAVIAAELGTYGGTPAYLVVMPHPVLKNEVQVYVIDARCITAAPAATGKLLVTHAYPRP